MKKLIYILLFISFSSFSLYAGTDEAEAFKAFHAKKWSKAASLYYDILRTDTPFSSSEQYGRAIISAAQINDSVKTFFFINKLNEHSNYSEDYVANIEQALELEKYPELYEPVLLYICSISKKECANIQEHILDKYNREARYEEAYRALNKLLAHYPGDNKLIFTIAKLETLLGRPDEAILYARQVLVNDPYDLDANIFLGNLYLKKAQNQIDSLQMEFKNKKGNFRRNDLIQFQLSLKDIIHTDLDQADFFLNKANSIKSNAYIRNNLSWIKKIKEDNTNAMIRLKLINVETLLP